MIELTNRVPLSFGDLVRDPARRDRPFGVFTDFVATASEPEIEALCDRLEASLARA